MLVRAVKRALHTNVQPKGLCGTAAPHPSNKNMKLKHNLKNADFVNMVIPNVLHDLPFENKVKNSENLRKNKKKQD